MRYSLEKLLRERSKKRWKNGRTTCENNGKSCGYSNCAWKWPTSGEYFITAKAAETEKTPAMPLDTCGAMSQGMIGYWMENAIEKALKNGI